MKKHSATFNIGKIAKSIVAIAIAAAAVLPINANAQSISPIIYKADENGVNIPTGSTVIPLPKLSIPAAPKLSLTYPNELALYVSGQSVGQVSQGVYVAHLGNATRESFVCSDHECRDQKQGGSVFYEGANILIKGGSQEVYHFTNKNYNYVAMNQCSLVEVEVDLGMKVYWQECPKKIKYYVSSINFKDGEKLEYTYETAPLTSGSITSIYHRPVKITSNTGYFLTASYLSNNLENGGWGNVTEIALFSSTAPSVPLAKHVYDNTNKTITDLAGNTFSCFGCSFTIGSSNQTSVGSLTLPGETSPSLSVESRLDYPLVSTVTNDGITWNYNYQNIQYVLGKGYVFSSVNVAGPNNSQKTYSFEQKFGVNYLKGISDALGRTTNLTYDDSYRISKIVYPEGNSESNTYDECGNVTSKTRSAKTGSQLANTVEIANYIDYFTCEDKNAFNPSWIKDAKGNQTDFVYNDKGFLTEITLPADANGQRLKTIVEYEPNALVRKAVERKCTLNSTCGTNNEFRTEYVYWNNTFLPRIVRQVNVATGEILETITEYDAAGRPISVDGPRTDVDDKEYYTYDVIGRKVFEIGPDPDGVAALPRSMVKYFYDSKSRIVRTEKGYGQSATGSDFVATSFINNTYDNQINKLVSTSSGTVQ